MNLRSLRTCAWVLLALCSCQSFHPPSPELRQLLTEESHEGRRQQANVRITSEWFQGEFRAIKIERWGAQPCVRFQLFPELGGKLLDLVVRADGVLAYWPHTGEVLRERKALAGFLAVSLMENATALTWKRVRGSRQTAQGSLLDVEPASLGLDLQVHVAIDGKGTLLARHYVLDGVGWTEDLVPRHRIHSRNFDWQFVDESVQSLPRPKDALFELKVPGNEQP